MRNVEAKSKAQELTPLPYGLEALEPHISSETLAYHYGKHHRGYVDKLNKLIAGTNFEGLDLEDIVRLSNDSIFNNAAQVWNHDFYWNSLTPKNKGGPTGALADAINRDYESVEAFKREFNIVAMSKFGSGWTWVIRHSNGSLAIRNTDNADTPIRHNQWPILVCDVWEHAYYLDHRNDRGKYLESFWQLANWGFAESNFRRA
jgi:superoxide dismutase, Fe-Mn family